ncbi:death domain-containing protein [Endozoicomonas sp. 4G]|uniref:death domain-containing protein n=1 Tax=Endozoicomonas sp. 4G TaxID=2872754 RepID=UPI002078754C|nr:death domain-containing protein [Endozoicomonas sp. 4G]
MKTASLQTMVHHFLLFILSVILPLTGHSASYTNLLSWTGWGSSSKNIEKWSGATGDISKLSFIGNNPPLLLTYDRKAIGGSGKAVSELENNQFYVILDSHPGDQFNFCFRTPPASSTENLPSPPVFKKPVTGQGIPDIQNGGMRRVASTPERDRWQHEYSTRWRLPAGHQSLVLTIEDNDNGWVIEPECSGILSESTALPPSSGSNTPANKKSSFVDIFYRNQQAVKNEPDHSDDSSHFTGPFAIPGNSGAADNSKPFTSSGGDSFGSGDDFGNLFKKRPGSGMGPLYSFEWMSEQFSRVIMLPGTDGQTVKKQIWDTRIVLKIKQGWNEQAIIISQELWDKIKGANLERSSGLFLALSRNPDNPEAVFDHYQNSNPPQPLQTEDYRRYTQQEFVLSPKQLRSVSVFPGHVPTGIGHPGGAGTSQAETQTDFSSDSSASAQFQGGYGRQNQGSGGGKESGKESGRKSGGDDGSGGSPDSESCQICGKPVLAYNKCRECLDCESCVLEQEQTKEKSPAIGQDNKEVAVSGTQEADASAIHVFEWFKTLKSNERQKEVFFRISIYYNSPELYNLLARRFFLDKNALVQFHAKWIDFIALRISLYELISEVGELAQSQGVEDYVEVTRIIKALALYRSAYEEKTSSVQHKNELLIFLTSKNLLVPDDLHKVSYSGLDRQQKAVLIDSIYKIFKKIGELLQEEAVPTDFKIIKMLNTLARDVYSEYFFGLPVVKNQALDVIMWGYANQYKYSFITPSNKNELSEINSLQTLQDIALIISTDGSSDIEDIKTMFTALIFIGSMLEGHFKGMFFEHDLLAKTIPREQLVLLGNFNSKVRGKFFEALELREPEERDELIRNMFLIFGMVPKEISNLLSWEFNYECFPLTQAAAYVTRHPHYHPFKTSTPQSVIMGAVLPLGELLNVGFKLAKDWKNFARHTDVFSDDNIKTIDANIGEDVGKAMLMLEQWKTNKVQITFKELLVIIEKIKRYDLRREIMDRYGL